jgi:hypothetical protein
LKANLSQKGMGMATMFYSFATKVRQMSWSNHPIGDIFRGSVKKNILIGKKNWANPSYWSRFGQSFYQETIMFNSIIN